MSDAVLPRDLARFIHKTCEKLHSATELSTVKNVILDLLVYLGLAPAMPMSMSGTGTGTDDCADVVNVDVVHSARLRVFLDAHFDNLLHCLVSTVGTNWLSAMTDTERVTYFDIFFVNSTLPAADVLVALSQTWSKLSASSSSSSSSSLQTVSTDVSLKVAIHILSDMTMRVLKMHYRWEQIFADIGQQLMTDSKVDQQQSHSQTESDTELWLLSDTVLAATLDPRSNLLLTCISSLAGRIANVCKLDTPRQLRNAVITRTLWSHALQFFRKSSTGGTVQQHNVRIAIELGIGAMMDKLIRLGNVESVLEDTLKFLCAEAKHTTRHSVQAFTRALAITSRKTKEKVCEYLALYLPRVTSARMATRIGTTVLLPMVQSSNSTVSYILSHRLPLATTLSVDAVRFVINLLCKATLSNAHTNKSDTENKGERVNVPIRETMENVAELWSSAGHLQHSPLHMQIQVTIALLSLMKSFESQVRTLIERGIMTPLVPLFENRSEDDPNTPPGSSEFQRTEAGLRLEQTSAMSSLMNGVQLRLQSPALDIRLCGMAVAQEFSRILDPANALDFGGGEADPSIFDGSMETRAALASTQDFDPLCLSFVAGISGQDESDNDDEQRDFADNDAIVQLPATAAPVDSVSDNKNQEATDDSSVAPARLTAIQRMELLEQEASDNEDVDELPIRTAELEVELPAASELGENVHVVHGFNVESDEVGDANTSTSFRNPRPTRSSGLSALFAKAHQQRSSSSFGAAVVDEDDDDSDDDDDDDLSDDPDQVWDPSAAGRVHNQRKLFKHKYASAVAAIADTKLHNQDSHQDDLQNGDDDDDDYDDDDSFDDDSDDETLEAYDLTDDRSDLRKVKPPTQLRECLDYLRKSVDKEPEYIEAVLDVAADTFRANAESPELKYIAVALAEALVRATHNLDRLPETELYEQKRMAAMQSLLVVAPKPVSACLIERFHSTNETLYLRLSILDAFEACAAELAQNLDHAAAARSDKNRDKATRHGSGAFIEEVTSVAGPRVAMNAANLQSADDQESELRKLEAAEVVKDRIEAKTRRWGRRTRDLATPGINRFAVLSGDFFFPLIRRASTNNNVMVFLRQQDPSIVARFLHTLGTFIEHAALAPLIYHMCRELTELLFITRYHKEPSVRRGTLFALSRILGVVPAKVLMTDFRDVVSELSAWLVDLQKLDADDHARQLGLVCLRLLNRALQQQQQQTIQMQQEWNTQVII
jgi:Telomere length regulation protein